MSKLTQAVLVVLAAAGLLTVIFLNWHHILLWARDEQRAMQTHLALAIQAVRSGDRSAMVALLGACAMYGILHAVGPGHGKMLIGSAAVASRRTAWRMASIGFSASLVQAATAIVLAYGGLGLLSVTGGAIIGSANRLLVPLSFGAMALVGIWILARGLRLVMAQSLEHNHAHDGAHHSHDHAAASSHDHAHVHTHAHDGSCDAGCKHMPTVQDAEKIESWRDVVALVLSIGVRPCSGALIVLIISWQLGLYVVGALSAFVMAVGTGLIVGLVALFATAVRDSGLFRLSTSGGGISLTSFGWIQMLAGGAVTVVCIALIVSGVSVTAPMGLVR